MSGRKRGKKTTLKTPRKKAHEKEESRPLDDIDEAIAEYEKAKSDKKRCPDVKEVNSFTKKFKQACDMSKREAEKLDRQQAAERPAGKTRSGTIRRAKTKSIINSDGKWINRGMDEANERFDVEERNYLEGMISKLKAVKDLNFDQLRYLVLEVFLDDLRKVKSGEVKSQFHDRYFELGDKATDLFAEIRTSLFTNEQRDYLNGLLLGAFDAVSKDVNGDIKHLEMRYVTIVMLAEITIRIVKYVHKFKSDEEAFAFMMKSSREDLGLGDDDD